MKHPNRVQNVVVAGWLSYLAITIGSWMIWEHTPYRYRQGFDEQPQFTHDGGEIEGAVMKLWNFVKTFALVAAVALGSLMPDAHAQSVTPTINPYRVGIDYRRNPSINVEPPATYVTSHKVSAGTAVSLTAPVSGTATVKYTLSPVITGFGGSLCDFLIRNNGAGTPGNSTGNAVSDGSAWEQNRTSGWIMPAASDATTRWVGFYNPMGVSCQFTVTWESMINQGNP